MQCLKEAEEGAIQRITKSPQKENINTRNQASTQLVNACYQHKSSRSL
jgi:hypothetical protein